MFHFNVFFLFPFFFFFHVLLPSEIELELSVFTLSKQMTGTVSAQLTI